MKNCPVYIALTLILGFLAGYYSSNLCSENEPVRDIKIFRDTVFTEAPREPLIIEKVRTKIKYRTDTLLLTAPFEARIDTVIKYDTIRAGFNWPENIFSLSVRMPPDTLKFSRALEIRTIEKPRPWWELPAAVAGGFLTGYFVSSINSGK